MDLKQLPELASDFKPYLQMKTLEAGGAARVVELEGLGQVSKAFILSAMDHDISRPIAVVTYTADQADRLAGDLRAFTGSVADVVVLPSTAETLLYTEGAPDYSLIGKRLDAMERIAAGSVKFVVGPVTAFLQRTAGQSHLLQRRVRLKVGDSIELEQLEKKLVANGYERVEAVELPGQWTKRGGLIDVFPADMAQPLRLDFFGDEIESIRPFDPGTQRSIGRIEELALIPAREMPFPDNVDQTIAALRAELPGRIAALKQDNLDGMGDEHAARLEERVETDIASIAHRSYFDQAEAYMRYLYSEGGCVLDMLTHDTILVVDEPHQARGRWDQSEKEMVEIVRTRAARGEWICDKLPTHVAFARLQEFAGDAQRKVVVFSLLARNIDWLAVDRQIPAASPAMEEFSGRLPAFFETLDAWLGNRLRCVIVSKQAQKVRDILSDHRIAAAPNTRLRQGAMSGDVFVLDGTLSGGFKMPDAGLIVIADGDMFGAAARSKIKHVGFKKGLRISSYLELREGDYVVHIHHGIGVYRGLTRLKGSDGAERDYLLLEYAGADKVYVPTDQVDRVQRYIGSNGDAPTIHRLNSGEWQRATKAAKKQVQEMAAELIKLYAARQATHRPACAEDTPWQEEMEEAFVYEETNDQLTAVADIKHDLESTRPMDRLICGDVGYGKTEVAMRAAFKMVNSGRQVAVLCPTTILAQQHLNTFRQRLSAYPVSIEMLSRFVARSEANKTVKGLMDGIVDIVIGTHRLLSKDVRFNKLGLLIVDEEQRFGVTHKEKIKAMRKQVDVLTLTATPIPRTLHMALSGIRDLSLIDDPPEGRLPIRTYVREFDDEIVREVLLRELDRDGQIYYVSNRIESIYHVAERIQRLVPNAKVEVAHGQMHEDQLEEAMLRFYNKEYDILVCTTIIESGLDVSNVNTIVIDNADKLGLAQLYQLRGRVGRSDKQGYAYLLYRRDKVLSEVAQKRLSALREFSDLGSGYKVALRDLEIRGAGNLLGAEQSGTVAAVGFDLYTQLLSQAINELKGEPEEREFALPSIHLPLDAHIPVKYIPSEAERILIYKKLTAVRATADVDDIQAELEDRYGDPPRSVWNLLALLRLRLQCLAVGIGSISTEKHRIILRFVGTHLPPETVRQLSRQYLQYEFYADRVVMTISDTPSKTMSAVESMVDTLAAALPNKDRENRIGVSAGTGAKLNRVKSHRVTTGAGFR